MQAAPSSMASTTASTTSPAQSTGQSTQGSQPHQPPHPPMTYENQVPYQMQYYAAPMPTNSQTMSGYIQPAQNGQQTYGAPQTFYQDQNGQYVPMPSNGPPQQMMMPAGQTYLYMGPQQGGQQGQMMPAPQQMIYYPQQMGPMPPQGAPMYYQPIGQPPQMVADQMGVLQPVAVMQNVGPLPVQHQSQGQPAHLDIGNQRAPLTSSTPLPTSMEYETAQREINRHKSMQFRYHRGLDNEEFDPLLPIGEISEIIRENANDDTMSAEKENHNHEPRSDKAPRRSTFAGEAAGHGQPASNYKTRLCMMHASGTKPCEMGARCKFAHGLKELRAVDVAVRLPNNKYKTKLCKNFARGGTGFCPYGLRCEFVHPTDKEFHNIPPYQRMLVDEKGYDEDVTPEAEDYIAVKQHQRMLRSSGRATTPTKVLLKHRNVAGSMMCLSQTGRESNMAGGDFIKSNNSQEGLPPHLRSRGTASRMIGGQMAKATSRRVSLKNKWTSEENLGRHHY